MTLLLLQSGPGGAGAVAPVNTVLPVISGVTGVGSTLSTTNGSWSGSPPPTYTYQWKRGGSNISGATANTYLLVSADIAATITVTVTATNTAGSASATSTGVGPITTLGISGTPVTTGDEYEHGIGSSYAGFTVTGSGGATPYTYSIASGTLPAGITLNSGTGAVSGTPGFQSAGTYSGIVIRVTDAVSTTANLASFTLTINFKDPYYSNVTLLLDYDAADGNATFTDQKSAAAMTVSGNAQHDTGITPLYGTSAFLFDGSGDALRFADSASWDFGSGNFTIDFTVRPANVTGVQFWIGQWQAAGTQSWVLFANANLVSLNVSTTGSDNLTDLTSTAGTLAATTWSRWRVDYNGTKYRLYKDGTMIASATVSRTIFNSTSNLCIGSNSAVSSFYLNGSCRGIRLTKGTARTNSDSGYTISNRAFPTS